MSGDKSEKEEKAKKKEYETIKIKRGGLEKVRDVFSILRDLLLILVLIGLVFVLLIGLTLLMNASQILNNVQTQGLGALLGGSGAGGLLPLSKMGGTSSGDLSGGTKTVRTDAETCNLLADAVASFSSGDMQNTQQILGQLKTTFKKKGMTEQTQLIDKITNALSQGNVAELIVLAPQLENSIQC